MRVYCSEVQVRTYWLNQTASTGVIMTEFLSVYA